jgi:hypothetical protein
MIAIFDEAKGVYRVNHADGSFDTYTKEQYHNMLADAQSFTPETVTVTENDLSSNPGLEAEGIKAGDVGTVTGDSVDFSNQPSTGDAPVDTTPSTGDVLTSGDGVASDITSEAKTQI